MNMIRKPKTNKIIQAQTLSEQMITVLRAPKEAVYLVAKASFNGKPTQKWREIGSYTHYERLCTQGYVDPSRGIHLAIDSSRVERQKKVASQVDMLLLDYVLSQSKHIETIEEIVTRKLELQNEILITNPDFEVWTEDDIRSRVISDFGIRGEIRFDASHVLQEYPVEMRSDKILLIENGNSEIGGFWNKDRTQFTRSNVCKANLGHVLQYAGCTTSEGRSGKGSAINTLNWSLEKYCELIGFHIDDFGLDVNDNKFTTKAIKALSRQKLRASDGFIHNAFGLVKG